MDIRRLTADDVSSCGFSGDGFHLLNLQDAVERQSYDDCVLYGVFDGSRPVCIGGLNFLESPPEIWMLSTDPEFRRMGLASGLVKFLERAAKNLGFTEVSLAVEVDNVNASRLYRELGYVSAGFRTDNWYVGSEMVDAKVEVLVKSLGLKISKCRNVSLSRDFER